jgi:hypothetical protein
MVHVGSRVRRSSEKHSGCSAPSAAQGRNTFWGTEGNWGPTNDQKGSQAGWLCSGFWSEDGDLEATLDGWPVMGQGSPYFAQVV